MAKLRKTEEIFYTKEGCDTLAVTTSFMYEVSVYVTEKNRYFLGGSTLQKFKEPIKKLTTYSEDKRERFEYVLVGAPLKWLSENGYRRHEN